MQAFDLTETARLVGMKFAKAKNWTVDRPFTIPASAYQGGRGSMNLYSIEDVYLMAVANEFSKTGFAAAAIGKLVESLRPKYPDLRQAPVLTVWRLKPGGKFEISESSKDPDASIWVRLDVPRICKEINDRVKKRSQRKS